MAESSIATFLRNNPPFRGGGLRAEDFAKTHLYLREALSADKREGLRLAIRARWVALAVIGLFLPYLNPNWDVLYYEALLVAFALIGWAQLRAGQVTQSRRELLLIFCDLALMTVTLMVPNPFLSEDWPTAFQYKFEGFSYFYILLAPATMAYSWRTIFAYGGWTTGLWLGALILVALFGVEIPELSERAAAAFAGYERILPYLDPNELLVNLRIQELLIFLIVVATLALNGRRTNQLLVRQAEAARERANLARHFPPNIVDEMAERDQPLGAVRSQQVAVMFADIVGFTRMAERQTPDDVVALLRQFHGRMEAAVFDHHGTLDKFLGDGLMATFGTPDPGPGDAANALRCGRAMLAEIAQWNKEREAQGAEPIRVSIGLHYGTVVLGDIGSERRLEFAVLGDTVNVASRLEALTRTLGVAMVSSGDLVHAVAGDDDLLSDMAAGGAQMLRGRDEPIDVWTY